MEKHAKTTGKSRKVAQDWGKASLGVPESTTNRPQNPGKLPPKRQRFVDEYLIDLNGAQAAIRAGYSANCAKEQAARLLTVANVQAAVEKGMDERAQRTKISQDYVIATIRDTIERCKGLEAVRTKEGQLIKVQTEDGEAAVMCQFEPQAVLKGSELLGRHLKMFTDK